MVTVAAPRTTLRPPWVYLAQAGWILITVTTLVLFVLGQVETVQAPLPSCVESSAICTQSTLSREDARVAVDMRWSVPLLFTVLLATDILAKLGLFLAGLLIFWRKRDDWVALMMSAALAIVLLEGSAPEMSVAPLAVYVMTTIGFVLFVPLPFVFPNGRHEPRWTRWLSIPLAVVLPAMYLFGSSLYGVYSSLLMAYLVLSVYAMVYRFRRAANTPERQQIKWVTLGMSSALFVGMVYTAGGVLYPASQPSSERLTYMLLNGLLYVASYWALAIGIGVAILRHGLWTVDVVINRAIVFGALTAIVVAAYVLIVGGLGALFQSSGNLIFSLMATGLIALLFNPLRARLQRGVNRLMYGERDDPYSVLSRLRQRLDLALAPDAVLPAIAETVAQALKLPYAAIHLDGETVTDHGSLPPNVQPESFPLVYQGETIGHLDAAPRTAREPFTPAERRLLADIAHQAGIAAHAVRLTADLRNARERLVAMREEERRRLRRDLHDGLGPKLAGQALILEAVRDSLQPDPQSRALVDHLIDDSQTVVAEVRELVHGLRPPALDEFGLVGAVRAHAAQSQLGGLQITVVAPEVMPPLPAAVEVAAYRIAQEALTNVVRHAQASACEIRIIAGEDLRLEIRDDGRGLPPGRHAGVGLASMRERAEEIGGRCVIESGADCGTRVVATFPMAKK